MIVFVFLLATVSSVSLIHAAQDAVHRGIRAPQQKRLQYQTPDGARVNGKFYTGSQWHQESNQRSSRQESQSKRLPPSPSPQSAPAISKRPEVESSYEYRPFSAVPEHIKQLIYHVYSPQVPYVNPYAFFYGVNLTPSQDISEHSTPRPTPAPIVKPTYKPTTHVYRTNYPSRSRADADVIKSSKQKSGGVRYKNDEENSRLNFGDRRRVNTRPEQQDQYKRELDKDIGSHHKQIYHQQMPDEIQQLLQYQSQIPYNVLANQILFQFDKPFVPKPLPDDLVQSSTNKYPTTIYYIKPSGEIVDSADVHQVPGREIKYRNY